MAYCKQLSDSLKKVVFWRKKKQKQHNPKLKCTLHTNTAGREYKQLKWYYYIFYRYILKLVRGVLSVTVIKNGISNQSSNPYKTRKIGISSSSFISGLVELGWVLWYINHCRLLNAKSFLYISNIYNLVSFGFYGISTIVGYLMPKPHTYIYQIYDL